MKQTILILYIICQSAIIKAQLFVKFDLTDCNSCNSALYELSRTFFDKQITVVLLETYKSDSIDINNKYLFKDFKNVTQLYSNTKYNSLHQSNGSELIVEINGEKKYQSSIKKINISAIQNAIYSKGDINYLCLPNIDARKINEYTCFTKHIVMADYLDRMSIYDIQKNTIEKLIISDSMVQILYKVLYKDSFKKRFPTMQTTFKLFPSYKPKFIEAKQINSDTLLLLIQLDDYEIHGRDTALMSKLMVVYYNTKNRKLSKYYPIQFKGKQMQWFYRELIAYDKKLYIQINKEDSAFTTDTRNIVELRFKQNEFILDTLEPFYLSKKIIDKYPKINGTVEMSVNKYNLFAFSYGDSIYDIKKKIAYKLPLADSFYDEIDKICSDIRENRYGTHRYIQILDVIEKNEKEFSVLFLYKKIYYVATYTQKDFLIHKIDFPNNVSPYYFPKFYNSDKKIFFIEENKECFTVLNI